MNWLTAVGTGAGLGIVYYGGLWLTVRQVIQGRHRPLWLSVSRLVRFALLGVGFYGLTREGAVPALAGLGGLWLARWYAIRSIGGTR